MGLTHAIADEHHGVLIAPAVFLSSAYWLSAADCTHLTT